MPEQQTLWFKVLGADGNSIHGGTLQWSLPTRCKSGEWIAGDWHEVEGVLGRFQHPGLHITSQPVKWYSEMCRCWIAECGDDFVECEEDKRSCRRVRLLREATIDELASVNIFSVGYHEIMGYTSAWASGLASVRASGSASVRAFDSASVSASGSASVSNYSSDATIATPLDYAVVIDRSRNPPTIICGWQIDHIRATA